MLVGVSERGVLCLASRTMPYGSWYGARFYVFANACTAANESFTYRMTVCRRMRKVIGTQQDDQAGRPSRAATTSTGHHLCQYHTVMPAARGKATSSARGRPGRRKWQPTTRSTRTIVGGLSSDDESYIHHTTKVISPGGGPAKLTSSVHYVPTGSRSLKRKREMPVDARAGESNAEVEEPAEYGGEAAMDDGVDEHAERRSQVSRRACWTVPRGGATQELTSPIVDQDKDNGADWIGAPGAVRRVSTGDL
jgi:hypothetical protein